MRTDYITEAQEDIRQFNTSVRKQQDEALSLKNHLEKVRDKLTGEIDRLGKLANSLGQIAAENGAEEIKPRIGGSVSKFDYGQMERDLEKDGVKMTAKPNNAA